MEYDVIDINMGCPDKGKSEKQGCGSTMIKTPKESTGIIRAAKEGAVRAGRYTRIPRLPKTRGVQQETN